MKVSVKLEGLKEVEANFAALIASNDVSKSQAKSAYTRALLEAGAPMAEQARELVPVRSGRLRNSIAISAKMKNKVRDDAFRQAKKAGLDNAAAGQAARSALRAARDAKSAVEVYVGPASEYSRLGHLVEFGTKPHGKSHPGTRAQSFMRKAFEGTAENILSRIAAALTEQIPRAIKGTARSKATAARKAAKAAR
jgi:HK97 gp10 family phage protein